ncbi:MAG TPA: TraM recognition domain-containing protein [Chthoniobacterales bacterium]
MPAFAVNAPSPSPADLTGTKPSGCSHREGRAAALEEPPGNWPPVVVERQGALTIQARTVRSFSPPERLRPGGRRFQVTVSCRGEAMWTRRFQTDKVSLSEAVQQAREWLNAQRQRDRMRFVLSPVLLGVWAATLVLAWWIAPVIGGWSMLPMLLVGPVAWWCAPIGRSTRVTARLGSLTWDRNDFCRGWLITGDTGAGKTFAINALLHSVFKHEPDWGGLCCDEKGVYHETLAAMARLYGREDDLVLLQTRPDHAEPGWKPPARFNLLSDPTVPSSTYAKAVVDTASSLNPGAEDKGFFKTQAHKQIDQAIQLMRLLGLTPALHQVNELLQSEPMLNAAVQQLEPLIRQGDAEARKCRDHFSHFLRQPGDQLGGVRATIDNYLGYFNSPDVVEVFGAEENTFDFSDLDEGAILCLSMPQKYQTERRYVTTLLKLLFYTHALRRFDPRAPGGRTMAEDNLLVCWQDEAQRFVTESDGNVDVIRQARTTTVMAAQSKTSFLPALATREKAEVTLLNLRNRIVFRAADRACAESSADFIGKKLGWKKTYTRGKGQTSTSRSPEEEYLIKPYELLALPKFTAIVQHCARGHRKRVIHPLNPDGKVPSWYHGAFWRLKS